MKQELLDYIRRPIPQGIPIVPQSIPIVFFGEIDKARLATIAINPSNRFTQNWTIISQRYGGVFKCLIT
ncbi:MAG: hypothetical protein FWF78_01130 [Defluviitaleaceae bacterium]|nr:hypothetical protein [Defluviitaleaceae bacterium]